MKAAAFEELLASVREAGAICRGTEQPSRTTTFQPTDVKALRADLGLLSYEHGYGVNFFRNPSCRAIAAPGERNHVSPPDSAVPSLFAVGVHRVLHQLWVSCAECVMSRSHADWGSRRHLSE